MTLDLVNRSAASDDGKLWMLVIRKGLSVAQTFSAISAITEKGLHVTKRGVELRPVLAVRIEPLVK